MTKRYILWIAGNEDNLRKMGVFASVEAAEAFANELNLEVVEIESVWVKE